MVICCNSCMCGWQEWTHWPTTKTSHVPPKHTVALITMYSWTIAMTFYLLYIICHVEFICVMFMTLLLKQTHFWKVIGLFINLVLFFRNVMITCFVLYDFVSRLTCHLQHNTYFIIIWHLLLQKILLLVNLWFMPIWPVFARTGERDWRDNKAIKLHQHID